MSYAGSKSITNIINTLWFHQGKKSKARNENFCNGVHLHQKHCYIYNQQAITLLLNGHDNEMTNLCNLMQIQNQIILFTAKCGYICKLWISN